MNLRVTGIAVLVTFSVLGSIVLAVTDGPWRPSAESSVRNVTPTAGGSVCVAGGGESERDVDIVLASPPLTDAAEASSTSASGRGVLLAVDETVGRTAVGPYLPGSLEVERTQLGPEGWLWAGWADHPVVAWREWRSPGGPGEPRASVVSRCVASDALEWIVLGLSTDGGNEGLIDIVNPYTVDATFAVTLRTEAETFRPIALRNVSVPAGRRISVRVNDHLPEEPDIAAVVTVGAGRLAVEGLQRTTAGVGGVEGVASVPALTAPAVAWTLPWLASGPDVDGAVWVMNPEPRTVVVEAIAHTAQGAGSAGSVESFEIPADGFVRIAASDLAPTGGRVSGLTLRSETTGVYVAAGARFLSEDAGRTGIVRFVPSAVPDREWLDAGRHVPGRETVLHVVNLAESAAELRITLTTRTTDATDAPVVRTLDPGVVAPGAVRRVALPLDASGAWSVVVQGGEALVVSRTTTGEGLLEPVAIDALPSRAWRMPIVGSAGTPFDGWVARLGTSGDLRRALPAPRPADILPGAPLPVG
jgi:hypothetical protein